MKTRDGKRLRAVRFKQGGGKRSRFLVRAVWTHTEEGNQRQNKLLRKERQTSSGEIFRIRRKISSKSERRVSSSSWRPAPKVEAREQIWKKKKEKNEGRIYDWSKHLTPHLPTHESRPRKRFIPLSLSLLPVSSFGSSIPYRMIRGEKDLTFVWKRQSSRKRLLPWAAVSGEFCLSLEIGRAHV